jgi:hypothetical protein
MRRILAVVLLLSIPVVTVAGDNGYKVIYDGVSLTDTKTGAGIRLFIDSNQIRFVNGGNALAMEVIEATGKQLFHQNVI